VWSLNVPGSLNFAASLCRVLLNRTRAFFVVACVLAVCGCAAAPPAERTLVAPVEFRTSPGAAALRDGRPAFRAAFCDTLRADGLAAPDDVKCDRWLWRLSNEPTPDGNRVVPPADPQQLEVVLVTGAFSECVGAATRPFAAGAERLESVGARVRTIVVGGRSGTGHNARQIADSIAAHPLARDRKVILVGYSKGGLDILRFLVDFPELAAGVDAVVAVASPVFGTPLADLAQPAYSALVAKVPYEECPPGDGQVIASLRPAESTQWLAENPVPSGVRYYSLAAFTTREHVARSLVPLWKHLGATEVRNDGQVVVSDAVIPGSTLLALVNADHWGVAQQIELVHPVLAARRDPAPFPLEQLFATIVAFVADDLARAGPDGAGGQF
jgi:pimeloyl-ACP methyl ester carboxylesterase